MGDWVPFPEPGGPTRFVEKVSNSSNQEHYITEIKSKNVVNEETKDYKSVVIIALHKKHYDLISPYTQSALFHPDYQYQKICQPK